MRPGPLRELLPWVASLAFHGGLAALLLVIPAMASRESARPPIELVERKLPPPPPPPKKVEVKPPEPRPSDAPKVATVTKLPPRRTVKPPPEEPREDVKPAPEDTGPKTFGIKMEGGSKAAPGEGVQVPTGDSLKVDPKVTKKGKAPPPKPPQKGFKDSYGTGEEAPVAVITSYPKVLKQVTAEYPERMKELGIEGRVVLEITVDVKGKVIEARVVKSLHPELDAVASRAARQLLFSPATMKGTPVKVKIPYTFTFVLD